MVRPVGASGISGIGPIRSSGQSGGSRAGGALRDVANRIASRMAREFDLIDRDGGKGGHGSSGEDRAFADGPDVYEIGSTARSLTQELGGRNTDEGRIARSLTLFAQESAILMAARPGVASLDTIARAIAARDLMQQENVDTAITQIDQTTRDVMGARPN